MKILMQDALLRRKELHGRLRRLEAIKEKDLYEVKVERRKVSEGFDDVVLGIPKLDIENVTAAYDTCAKQLRKVDSIIQKTNWTTEVEVEDMVMEDFKSPPKA